MANLPQIGNMLNNARQSTAQVGTAVSFKRPDRAYVEYLISTELLLHVIPKHKDYPSLMSKQGEIYRALCKVGRNHGPINPIVTISACDTDNLVCSKRIISMRCISKYMK